MAVTARRNRSGGACVAVITLICRQKKMEGLEKADGTTACALIPCEVLLIQRSSDRQGCGVREVSPFPPRLCHRPLCFRTNIEVMT